jgi:hypothetical protein
VITEVLSPAVLVAGISLAVSWHSRSLPWGLVVVLFSSLIPISYIVSAVRRGHYRDHHVEVRHGRLAALGVAVASVVLGLVVMVTLHAPRDLLALVLAMLAGLLLTLAVTAFWKVSIHTAVASGTVVTLIIVFGPWLWLASPGPVAVAWSRIRLGDHTLAQTIVGALLGALASGSILQPGLVR